MRAQISLLANLIPSFCLFFIVFWPCNSHCQGCNTSGCHTSISQARFVHTPVKDGECEVCHVPVSKRHPSGQKKKADFKIADMLPELCLQCHDQFEGKFVHKPVLKGDCLRCHEVHSSDRKSLLRYERSPSELCFKCHDQERFTSKTYRHGPSSGGYCLACHLPHASNYRAILKESTNDICFYCHTDFERQEKRATFVHAPIKSKSCIACHDPHGSEYQNLVKDPMPTLCISCHEEIRSNTIGARYKHKALYLGKRCGNCHDIHFSKNNSLLHQGEKELCLSCHNKTDTRRSHPIRNIAKEIKGKKHLHGPLEHKKCIACHNPHGSRYWRMLQGPYPPTFYANYKNGIYDLCWQCHDRKILTFSYKKSFSKFSNGKENLHVVHVKKRLKGRTCRACHAPHASNWPHLINDKGAPFGEWAIPIRFKATKDGGSCVPGCHREMSYNRVHPVEYDTDQDFERCWGP